MTTINLTTNTTLTFKQLMTIADVLREERRVQAHATFTHDKIVKASLDAHPQKLEYLVKQQDANYNLKQDLDHAFYAIEEMIREFK